MSEIPKNNTGLSGEYFVAAELYRRGFSVGMTIGNAKSVDLFAEKNKKIVQLQVKSLFKAKHSGFPLMTAQIKDEVFYIFVILNGDKLPTAPDFYIATSAEVRKLIRQYETRGVVELSKLKNNQFVARWDKLDLVV